MTAAAGPSTSGASGERAFERFCAAGKPLRLFVVPAAIVFAAARATDPVIEYLIRRSIAAHAYSSPRAMFVVSVLTGIDSSWYVIAFVAPMLVASIVGYRSLRPMLLGRLTVVQLLGIALVVPPSLAVFSAILGMQVFEFPHLTQFQQGTFDDYVQLLVVAPFTEEMFFQVALQTNLQRFGWFVAVLGASLPFVYAHAGSTAPYRLAIFVLPAVTAFAVIRQTTKSLGAALLTHVCCNVLSLFIAYGYR